MTVTISGSPALVARNWPGRRVGAAPAVRSGSGAGGGWAILTVISTTDCWPSSSKDTTCKTCFPIGKGFSLVRVANTASPEKEPASSTGIRAISLALVPCKGRNTCTVERGRKPDPETAATEPFLTSISVPPEES